MQALSQFEKEILCSHTILLVMIYLHVLFPWFLLLNNQQQQHPQQQLSPQRQQQQQHLLDYRQLRQHPQSRQVKNLLLEVRSVSSNAETPKIFQRRAPFLVKILQCNLLKTLSIQRLYRRLRILQFHLSIIFRTFQNFLNQILSYFILHQY